jgi:hypothetical protein
MGTRIPFLTFKSESIGSAANGDTLESGNAWKFTAADRGTRVAWGSGRFAGFWREREWRGLRRK